MIKRQNIWDKMQVVDIYEKAYLRHDANCWCIWSSLFETRFNLMIYAILDAIQVVDIYEKAY